MRIWTFPTATSNSEIPWPCQLRCTDKWTSCQPFCITQNMYCQEDNKCGNTEGRPDGGCSSSQGAEGQRWALLSVTATGPEGTAWSCQGRGSGGSGTGAAPEGGGLGTGCPGLWARPPVPEFMEHLDTAFGHWVWFWADLCGARSWDQWSLQSLPAWDIPWFWF